MADAETIGGDTLKGAATGAAVGSYFGPIGTVVGAVVGAVAGFVEGLFVSKAHDAIEQANAYQGQIENRQAALQRRTIVRNFYLQRAQSLAAGTSEDGGSDSSATLGALGSAGAQGNFNLNYFDTQVHDQRVKQYYQRKADKLQTSANFAGDLIQAGGAVAKAYGSYGSFNPGTSGAPASQGDANFSTFQPSNQPYLTGQTNSSLSANYFNPGL